MKPTTTAHILRKINKELDGDLRIDDMGFLSESLSFPSTSLKTAEFARQYFLYNLARKREVGEGDASPSQMRRALEKWSVSEWKCGVVNRCGRFFSPIGTQKVVFSELERLTTANLSRLLCDRWPDLSDLRFTGGATTLTPKKWSWGVTKYCGTPLFPVGDNPSYKCVPAAQEVLVDILEQNPAIARRYMRARDKLTIDVPLNVDREACEQLAEWLCQHEPVGRLDYVNKNIDEVRLIIKGEAFSVGVQKIFGDVIRLALKDVGIDLNDQTINQEWALIGSITGLVATVDLTSASDSVALRTLRYFPPRWQEYVMCTRDRFVSCGTSVRKPLEMVAGMGNGLIFELESALFWAFSLAVCQYLNLDTSWVSVYGDDIVIPSAGVQLLEEFLLYNGFELNKSKSFSGQDPFRESCGKHYHRGVDVTPVYVKGDLDSEAELYRLINELSYWEGRTGWPVGKSLSLALSHLPENARHVVPQSWGTTSGLHFAIDSTCTLPKEVWNRRYQRMEIVWKALTPQFLDVTDRMPEQTQVVASLQALENANTEDLTRWLNKLPLRVLRPHQPWCTETNSRKADSVDTWHRPSNCLYEANRGRVTWLSEGQAKLQLQRGVTLARDA